MARTDFPAGTRPRYSEDRTRDRWRSTRSEWPDARSNRRVQGGSNASRERDYYGDEGRRRQSQWVSPGGEYYGDRYYGDTAADYDTEDYTRQGYGENRGHSDWRTEDKPYGTGQYRGVGPRGYRRSDARIREDVCDALTDDPRIDASGLEVEVKDCEVILSGTVHSRRDKRIAEDVAGDIAGVKDVQNQLRCAPGG